MKISRTIVTKVSMCSEASEADLHAHMNEFIDSLKAHSEQMTQWSWNQDIHTSWEESYPVDITVDVKAE